MVLSIFILYTAESRIWHGNLITFFIVYFHMILLFSESPVLFSQGREKLYCNENTLYCPTLQMQQKIQPSVVGNLDDLAICTSTAKILKQTFSSRIGTFICWYVDCSACGLHIKRLKRKNNKKKKKLRPLSKKTALASEYYYTCENVLLFIFSWKLITWKLRPDRV